MAELRRHQSCLFLAAYRAEEACYSVRRCLFSVPLNITRPIAEVMFGCSIFLMCGRVDRIVKQQVRPTRVGEI